MAPKSLKDELTAQLHAMIQRGETKGKRFDELYQKLLTLPRQTRSPWESITVVPAELKEKAIAGEDVAMEYEEEDEEEDDDDDEEEEEEDQEEEEEEEEDEEESASPLASECSEASTESSE